MLAPIVSKKHFVPQTNTIIASGAILNVPVIEAVIAPAVANSRSVIEGATIKAVFLEYWMRGNDSLGNASQQIFTVEKVPAGATSMTAGQSLALQSYPNKKNILFTSQGILGDLETVPVPILRQWIKIPKGKQRFGLGDELIINFASGGGAFRVCGMAIYKEYQ